ncbi:MAG: hypothetical protein ACYCVE_04130 [Gemmatimonadaceae bacterium]
MIVVDASPTSRRYGELETVVLAPGPGVAPHHVNDQGPIRRRIFAGDLSGSAFAFDISEPAHPRVVAVLPAVPGLTMPHEFLADGHGHVYVTYQYGDAMRGTSGGLAEFTDNGTFVAAHRLSQAETRGREFHPYSLTAVAGGRTLLVTGTNMAAGDSSTTIQSWSVAPMKPVWTRHLPAGPGETENEAPASVHTLQSEDAAVLSTYRCGLYEVAGFKYDHPHLRLVYKFPGSRCGMGTLVDSTWYQCVAAVHGVMAVRIRRDGAAVPLTEVALGSDARPHWIFAARHIDRLVVTGEGSLTDRVVLLTYAHGGHYLHVDEGFRDRHGEPTIGVDIARLSERGLHATFIRPHGAVVVP